MVVATHGRSIWILDDLTPLHQLYDRLRSKAAKRGDNSDAVLFKPRATVRLRIVGGYAGVAAQANISRGPAWPGMVNYARTGASIFRVLPRAAARRRSRNAVPRLPARTRPTAWSCTTTCPIRRRAM